MGKMKREWEAMRERGEVEEGGAGIGTAKYKKLGNENHNDPYNLWDNDDKGDAQQDVEHLNHLMNSLDTD